MMIQECDHDTISLLRKNTQFVVSAPTHYLLGSPFGLSLMLISRLENQIVQHLGTHVALHMYKDCW